MAQVLENIQRSDSISQSHPACSLGVCAPVNISTQERWISAGAGLALFALGARARGLSGLLTAGMGAALLYRGATGHCHAYEALGVDTSEHHSRNLGVPAQQGVRIEERIEIDRPAHELFAFWRDFRNLPQVMQHLDRVETEGTQRSHWVACAPGNIQLEWDAEIINERPNNLIAWRSLPGSSVQTAGSVHFNEISPGRTEMTVNMKYNPPGGMLTDAVAKWFGTDLEQVVCDDLQQFKQRMESAMAAHPRPM